MDPNAALATMLDHDADRDERISAAEALREWLARGGAMPDAWNVDTYGRPFTDDAAARRDLAQVAGRLAAWLAWDAPAPRLPEVTR